MTAAQGSSGDILGCPMMSYCSGSTAALGADWSREVHCDTGAPERARSDTRPACSSAPAAVSGHCSASGTLGCCVGRGPAWVWGFWFPPPAGGEGSREGQVMVDSEKDPQGNVSERRPPRSQLKVQTFSNAIIFYGVANVI